ncbi:MAG: cysteine hydrolase family protein [Candidatus Krumholzibacteriia bacterium]
MNRTHRFRAGIALATLVLFSSVNAFSGDSLEDPATALIIVDIQDFYFPGGALPLVDPEPAAAAAARVLDRFRDHGQPVVHVGHNAPRGKGFYDAVAPLPGEMLIFKDEVNAFKGTALEFWLREQRIRRVVICGMQTHMCAEAAVREASDLGFEVVMIADACATRDLTFGDRTVPAAAVHAATLATLDRVYATVMTADEFLAAHP